MRPHLHGAALGADDLRIAVIRLGLATQEADVQLLPELFRQLPLVLELLPQLVLRLEVRLPAVSLGLDPRLPLLELALQLLMASPARSVDIAVGLAQPEV